MAAYTTASEVSIRENLSDYLSILDPADIPLQASLSRVPVTQKKYEYTVDDFGITRTVANISSAAKAENGAFFSNVNGTTNFSTDTYPQRLQSIQQINWDGVSVSATDRVSVMAGVSDAFEYRLYRTMVRVSNDQDMALLAGTGSAPGASTRLTQGLIHWIAQTGLGRSSGASSVGTNGIWDVDGATSGVCVSGRFWANCYNAGNVNLDLSMLTDKVLGAAVDNGFKVPGAIGFAGRKVKSLLAAFALTSNGPLNYRQIAASDNMVSENVSYIETASHGVLRVVYNRYFDFAGQSMGINNTQTGGSPSQPVTTAVSGNFNGSFPLNKTLVVIMPEYWKIATLRGLGWGPLPRLTDGDVGVVVGEQGLVCLNPIAGTGVINCIAG